MATRNELVTALAERYARSSKAERGVILDEFVAVSGYHRKHAIRLLRSGEKPTAAPVRRVRRRYGDAVREALIALWEASDRLSSKRLKPLLPVLLPALEQGGAVQGRGSQSIVPILAHAEETLSGSSEPTADLLTKLILSFPDAIIGTQISAIPKIAIAEARNFPDLAGFYLEEVVRRGKRLIKAFTQGGIERGEFRAVDENHALQLMRIVDTSRGSFSSERTPGLLGEATDGRDSGFQFGRSPEELKRAASGRAELRTEETAWAMRSLRSASVALSAAAQAS